MSPAAYLRSVNGRRAAAEALGRSFSSSSGREWPWVNPAVTIGFWSVRRFPASEVLPYVAAQCGGAALASAALTAALGPVGDFGATMPRVPTVSAFGIEWLLSFRADVRDHGRRDR